MDIPAAVRTAIEAGPIAHVVTIAPDGQPQISMAWIGLEDGEVVIATMYEQAKLRNIRRDPRMALSFETGRMGPMGLPGYIVLHGHARVTEGQAPETLQRLAYTYIGPDVVFPNFPNAPAGWVTRITVERISGSDEAIPNG
jgi:PPOX class probable F420-dependent enzyme